MIRRLFNKRGGVPVKAIIIIVIVVIIAVVAFFLMNGLGLGGNIGNGTGNASVTSVQSESAVSEPVTEELDYIEVTVYENEYLYQNSKYELEELIDKLIIDAENVKVKITDDNASKRAYNNLISALEEKNISYIKSDV